jgi:DNA invertase Pin-like site-specific DNA recombinase
MTCFGYVRVSTDKQGRSGLGLEAQEQALRQWHASSTRHNGTGALQIVREVGSGGKTLPGLSGLLRGLQRGDVLAVAKADRLARSTVRVLSVAEELERQGCELVLLDLGIDSTTPAGKMVLTVMAALSQWERAMIGVRTRDALAAKVAREGPDALRRPEHAAPAPVMERVLALRAEGLTLRQCAARLEVEGVPTSSGRPWSHGSVAWLLRRHQDAVA